MLEELTNLNREKPRGKRYSLLCDEIITGFRERYGSCNSSRKANPDIVIFGKTAALGFPIGIVLVSKEIVQKLVTTPFWGGTSSASPTQIYYLKKLFLKLMQLDYTTINKNLLTIHKLLNDSVENAGFVIKSGCLFSRILMSDKNNDSRAFISNDSNFKMLQKNCTILVFLLEIMHLFFHQSTTTT